MARSVLVAIGLALLSALTALGAVPPRTLSPAAYPAVGFGCLADGCHAQIEPVRPHDSDMAKQIYLIGKAQGDPNGCVVCHGGNVHCYDMDTPHKGAPAESLLDAFTNSPTALSVVEKTCGQCHSQRVQSVQCSGMMTGTGHLTAILKGWGLHKDATYGVRVAVDTDGTLLRTGTPEYQRYMQHLQERQQNMFAERVKELPYPTWHEIEQHPALAGYLVAQTTCLRCHIGTATEQGRGSGCAACHSRSIRQNQTYSLSSHTLQGTENSPVMTQSGLATGIQKATCARCHTEGKHIAASYAGTMALADGVTKTLHADVHHHPSNLNGNPSGGLICQDCHTTRAMHGTGNIAASGRVQVEIECADCHGTPDHYPWELPFGFQDEFATTAATGDPRGTLITLPPDQQAGKHYAPEDGYLLSARGNPLGNVVRRGQAVVVHSATGTSFFAPVLKHIALRSAWKTPERAIPAKMQHPSHMQKLECYSCHSAWVPQQYGTHMLVNGEQFPADVLQQTERFRWEEPVLGRNGEGRVSPLLPAMQLDVSLIAPDGALLLHNHIFPTHASPERARRINHLLQKTIEDLWDERRDTGTEAQAVTRYRSAREYAEQSIPLNKLLEGAFYMVPVAPHTVTRNARTCESCHMGAKALGYGNDIGFGQASSPQSGSWLGAALSRSASFAHGEILGKGRVSRRHGNISARRVPYEQVTTTSGEHRQQVGFHWILSSPLSQEQRQHMETMNPFMQLRTGNMVTEGKSMVIGTYEIDAMIGTGIMLLIIIFVIIAAFIHSRRCDGDWKNPRC